MPDVTYNEDHYDYTLPDAADPDSSLPLELDVEQEETRPAVTSSKGVSVADRFRQDFGHHTVPTTTIPVPGREGWSLRFRLDWTEAKARTWRKQAKDQASPDGYSTDKLYRAMIADQCTAVLLDGEPVVIQGETWTFKSKALQAEFEVHTPMQAVQRCIPLFTHLVVLGQAVTNAAGSDDLLDPM